MALAVLGMLTTGLGTMFTSTAIQKDYQAKTAPVTHTPRGTPTDAHQ